MLAEMIPAEKESVNYPGDSRILVDWKSARWKMGVSKMLSGTNSALVHAMDGTHVRAPSPSFRDFANHL